MIIKDGKLCDDGTKEERASIRIKRLNGGHAVVQKDKKNEIARISNKLICNSDGKVACARCGYAISGNNINYKSGLRHTESDIREANPLIVDPKIFIDPEMVFRQFFCPSCATQIETEVILASSNPVWDKKLQF